LARSLGELADGIALHFFLGDVRCESKADGSPVTEADLAVERALVDVLTVERPDDAILSEEGGGIDRRGSRRWLVDPIDGTSFFVAGDKAWGTHVALEVDGEITVGVITRPADGTSWWAAKGLGAWASSGARLRVSATSSLRGARIGGYVNPASAWRASVAERSTWVDSPSPFLELLEGRLDGVLSEGGFEWDHAPGVVLLKEAGGRFTDPSGGERIDLRGGLYTNGHLHTQLLEGTVHGHHNRHGAGN
jgi:histidinol-phosphatase